MKLFKYKYLSQDQLKRLETYKYASIDNSPLSTYVMHPFWDFVVKFVPMSIAPNVLTLAGFACTLMNAILLSYYDYNFQASSDDLRTTNQPVPSLVWLICAINLFLAHTLDGIDGKQARRTKATGPLGELMDHGVDSWTAVFIPLYVYSFFGSSEFSFGPHRMLFLFWAIFLTFYISHWEKYITGVLFLPWSYDISQLFLLGCSIITYWHSYKYWHGANKLFGWPYSKAFELILYVSIIWTMPVPFYNIYKSLKSGKAKQTSFGEILRPLIPLFALFLVSVAWANFSQTDVLSRDPRVYFYTVGTVFSNIVCRLIICQMSSTRCELINGFTILFSLVAFSSIILPTMAPIELMSLRILAFILTLAHLHYAYCVVQQMCEHFNIKALSLGKRMANDGKSRQHLLKNSTESLGMGNNKVELTIMAPVARENQQLAVISEKVLKKRRRGEVPSLLAMAPLDQVDDQVSIHLDQV